MGGTMNVPPFVCMTNSLRHPGVGGEEGFRQGGWFVQVGAEDREGFAESALDEALRDTAARVRAQA